MNPRDTVTNSVPDRPQVAPAPNDAQPVAPTAQPQFGGEPQVESEASVGPEVVQPVADTFNNYATQASAVETPSSEVREEPAEQSYVEQEGAVAEEVSASAVEQPPVPQPVEAPTVDTASMQPGVEQVAVNSDQQFVPAETPVVTPVSGKKPNKSMLLVLAFVVALGLIGLGVAAALTLF